MARSHLLLGSSNAIYRLDNSLMKQEKRSLTAPNRMLVTDYVGSFTDNVLSCSSDSCFLAQITDFTNVSWQVDPPFIRPGGTDNVAGVFAPRANGTSDLTYGERAGDLNVGGIIIAKGSLFNIGTSDGAQFFNRYARRTEGVQFDPLVYLTEFPLRFLANDSGYIYFVVHPIQGETRLVRFCENDGGSRDIFVSHFEIVLKCGMESQRALSTGATFLNITTTFNDRPTIVVSRNHILGTNSIQLEVCAFDIGTINSLMTQKYEDCLNRVNNAMSGFLRDGLHMECGIVSQPSSVSECFLPVTARPGLEVISPYTQQPLISLLLNSATTSMVHTVLDGTLFLFVATTNGSLLQFHIANSTTSTYVRTIQLPLVSVENVTKMVTSDNGEYVFALTPSTLVRHQVDMCDTLTSCSECVTSDPICGWCAPTGTCTRRSNCPSVAPVATPIWIEEASSCPSIDSITPPIIYIPELSNTITFTLTTSNIASTLLTMYSYDCQFRFRNANGNMMISDRMATQSNGDFTCTAPPSDHIPQLATGQDTLETMISLTVRGTDVSIAELNMTFPFTDCAVHESCTSCIGASRCEWCPFSFQCIQPRTECSNTQELTVSNGGVCPQIFPSSSTGEYLIHANYDYQQSPLRINSSDLTWFRNDFNNDIFRCQIYFQNDLSCTLPLFSLPASLAPSGNEVLCEQTRFDSTDSTPTISARLRVIWNNQRTIDNPDNASVILYSCSLMGTNCGQCLAQESRFECSYCVEGPAPPSMTGSCQLGASCSTGNGFLRFDNPQDVPNCPRPSISDFKPKAGPTRGGTKVTINGTNLGARREDIVRVMIDGVNCNVSDYAPGVSITCITGEKEGSVISDKVSIYFTHLPDTIQSAESFTFVTPFLNSPPASPERGPRSGGTNITIMGRDIGTGSTHRVLVSSRECEITEVMLNSINCTTPPGDAVIEVGAKELMEVFVDNWSFQLAGFQYVADPTFDSINPDFTFVVGGINYTISGENLDSVQEPRLLIYYDGVPSGGRNRRQTMQEGRFISEPCIVESPVRMYCTAPSLSSEFNQSSRPLRIGLLLDGVTSLLELNNSLNLFPDPVFTRFEEERVFTSGNPIPLTIEGEGFVFTTGQVNVLIEPCQTEVCQCTVMNVFPNNTLTCEINILSQQDLERSRPLMIIVAIGNFMQEVGTIRIQDQNQLEILYYLIPVFTTLILVALACGTMIGCVIVKTRGTRSAQLPKTELNPVTTASDSIAAEWMHAQEPLKQLCLPPKLRISSRRLRLCSKPIGQGEFGTVFKAKLDMNSRHGVPQTVAVKIIKGLYTASNVESMISEVSKMKDFQHPNVMSLIGVCLDAGPGVSIVMPFMANGSLLDYLKRERNNLYIKDDAELDTILSIRKLLLRICHQIAKGMEYLALQRFIHRDLAARNCMLDNSGIVKVGDFGLAEDVYTRGYFRQGKDDAVKLPFKWMAPESLRDGLFSEKSDVWSFGITCWEVFSAGRIPYPGVDAINILNYLEKGTRLEKPDNAACAPEIFSIMIKSWVLNPDDRPTFEKLCSTLDRLLQLSAGYLELGMQLQPKDQDQMEDYENAESLFKESGPMTAMFVVAKNDAYNI